MSAQTTFNEMTYTKDVSSFKLNAPSKAKSVKVNIYKEGIGGSVVKTVKMKRTGTDQWTADIPGDLKGLYYTFQVQTGKKAMQETPGVFAKAVAVNGRRAAIVDMGETNPEGWDNDRRPLTKSPVDLVIYEMHHRDFSISPTSGLKNKGKFLALTEPKAVYYLKNLGVNAVHLLPSFDYASVDESKPDVPQYNWGYDPLNYNVPEGSYSTDATCPVARIREFKQMVQALHKAGIRVILDVVYNHTFNIEESNFNLTYPGYYFRTTADGKISDGSGCGNETASEKPLMRQFMIESVLYWAKEYHIDGFRFDLMGIHDIETMNLIRKALDEVDPNIYMYGEGWSAGTCAYPVEKLAMKANTRQLDRIGAFCDDMRDAIRGPFNDDHKAAFLGAIPGNEESIRFGIAGCIDHPQIDISKVNYSKAPWANSPAQMISYISCHDDMCVVDRLKASIPGITTDELIRLDLLGQTMVFTSQGVPFIYAGEEVLRDKKGVHNSFKSPDYINAIDWTNKDRYPQVFDYYRGLMELRRNHPAFRMADASMVRQHLEFIPTSDCTICFRLKDNANGDSWQDIIVILNASKKAQKVTIPEGCWTSVCEGGIINLAGIAEYKGKEINVAPQEAIIIHR
ncbi:type I pullulanase [Prevotella sp. P3-122]|uniref:type I pullulanase n=1 Tax=Prevotella sp. P3-122 TaxID=2024223 RepID=UPI000B961D2A|nr:type I pullulanase [Prevotella sp. P3-122]OYP60757.1 type I pullulanase [Prevotella sp. P3-122]